MNFSQNQQMDDLLQKFQGIFLILCPFPPVALWDLTSFSLGQYLMFIKSIKYFHARDFLISLKCLIFPEVSHSVWSWSWDLLKTKLMDRVFIWLGKKLIFSQRQSRKSDPFSPHWCPRYPLTSRVLEERGLLSLLLENNSILDLCHLHDERLVKTVTSLWNIFGF